MKTTVKSKLSVATHSGVFHADEVFACAVLTLFYKQTRPDRDWLALCFLRTRDPEIIEEADFAVDVGGIYDPENGRYDHHQKGRAGARPNGVFYSSFGLVWKDYGSHVVQAILKDEAKPDTVARMVDEDLVTTIDASDNGQALVVGGERPFGEVRRPSVSSMISMLNPQWYQADQDRNAAFHRAVGIATDILCGAVREAAGRVRATDLVDAAVQRSKGGLVVTFHRWVPWQETLGPKAPNALYVVFPSEEGTWMVQGVPNTPGSFDQRLPLPERWAGLRDAEFAAESGVPDAVFAHPGCFICGARTLEGAMRLAKAALDAAGLDGGSHVSL